MGVPRALTLHESALNPQEWQTYTELFQELVEPPDTVLGVREARGYLKGRYSGLESGTVDKVTIPLIPRHRFRQSVMRSWRPLPACTRFSPRC